MNIIFTGLSGAGKSTVGRAVAQKIGYQFIDMPRAFEEIYGNISLFIEKYGVSSYGEKMSRLLYNISQEKNSVISLAGAEINNDRLMEYLRKNSIIIYLDRKVEDIIESSKTDKNFYVTRPFLKENISFGLQKMDLYRKPLFKRYASFTINGNDLNSRVEQTLKLLKDYI